MTTDHCPAWQELEHARQLLEAAKAALDPFCVVAPVIRKEHPDTAVFAFVEKEEFLRVGDFRRAMQVKADIEALMKNAA